MKGRQFGICVDVKLTTCMQLGLSETRKIFVLEQALFTLVNMVPDPEEDLK